MARGILVVLRFDGLLVHVDFQFRWRATVHQSLQGVAQPNREGGVKK